MIEAKGVNGQVRFDGKAVTIARDGLMAKATVSGERMIPVGSITAVQWKAPSLGVRGYIQFTLPGGVDWNSNRGSRVVFTKGQTAEFAALRDAVQQAIV
jgi:hypothetical protein